MTTPDPLVVTISGRLSEEVMLCPPCGTQTRRRLDVVTEHGAVLDSWSICDTCQQPLPWGVPMPAIWTEPAENTTAPIESVPHGPRDAL